MLKHDFEIGDSAAAPLALLVHGRAGNCAVMSAFKRVLPAGVSILMPEAPLPDPLGGFSWWEVKEHGEVNALGVEEAVRVLSQFIDEAVAHYSLTPSEIIALGFSQGGALLSALMQRKPSRFSRVALLASFVIEQPEGSQNTEPLPQVFIAHGTEDATVPVARARESQRYLEQRRYRVRLVEDTVGHKVGSVAMRALKEWLQSSSG